MADPDLGQGPVLLAALVLLPGLLSAQRASETALPPIRDVRPPSCFTPGPVRGLAPRRHAYGVFPFRERIVVAVTAGRDTTSLLELRPDGGGFDVTRLPAIDGEVPSTLRAAFADRDSLVLWTETRRYVLRAGGWSAGPNPEPELFRHHGSARSGTGIGIDFADFWVPMAWAWQWMTDLPTGERLLLWNDRLSANSYDGPDRPGIVEVPAPGRRAPPRSGDPLPPFHPLPTPSYETYQRRRLDEALDSLQRASLWLAADFGAWQRVGDEIWFGVSFYLGEGADGVGGYGRFDPAAGRYTMRWGVPDADRSVSALYHDGEALWLGLMGRRERGHPAYGVARVRLEDGSVARYDVPGVVTVLCPAGDHLLAGSREGLFRLEGGRFIPVRGPGSARDRTAPAQEARVAAARHDFDGDGRADTLELVMLEGRRYDDTTAWCGAGEKFEGRFTVRVHLASGATTRFPLPEYLFFRDGEGRVVVEDYNGDGRADFNLGQYATCNGWRYRLYTVAPSGDIRRLPVGPSSDAWLPVSDFVNSTDRIVPTERGFEVCFYDNATTHVRRRYVWHGETGRFVLAGERRVEGCPTGGPVDGASHAARSSGL